jgi:hypothetical protein
MTQELKKMELRPEIERQIGQLEKAGFQNCENIRTLRKQFDGINFDKYKAKYPTYLYFTDIAFSEVVKRNKLTVLPIEAYTGHIPERCLDAILNENIRKEDMRPNRYVGKITSSFTESGYLLTCDEDGKKTLSESSKEYLESLIIGTNLDGVIQTRFEVEKMFYGEGYANYRFVNASDRNNCTLDISFTLKDKDFSQLYIAAPASMIDGSKVKKSFLEKITITKQIQAPDPIVFRYVKDGILVITFWE